MMLYCCLQVYEFQDAQSGMLCVAQPPQGVSAASLVASALSWALGSPLRLPLEPLLTCNPDSLPRLQQTLFGGTEQSEQPYMQASWHQLVALALSKAKFSQGQAVQGFLDLLAC